MGCKCLISRPRSARVAGEMVSNAASTLVIGVQKCTFALLFYLVTFLPLTLKYVLKVTPQIEICILRYAFTSFRATQDATRSN